MLVVTPTKSTLPEDCPVHPNDPYLFIGNDIHDPREKELLASHPDLSTAKTPKVQKQYQPFPRISEHESHPRDAADVEIDTSDFLFIRSEDGSSLCQVNAENEDTRHSRSLTVILDQSELCALFNKSTNKSHVTSRWKAAILLQRWYRRIRDIRQARLSRRFESLARIGASKRIQSWWRQCLEKRQSQLAASATLIQSIWRQFKVRNTFLSLKSAILRLQWTYRSKKMSRLREQQAILKAKSATLIQSTFRTFLCRKQFRRLKEAARLIQGCIRRYLRRKRLQLILFSRRRYSARKIVTAWKGYLENRHRLCQNNAVRRIQSWWKMCICRRSYLQKSRSTTKIQSWWRMKLALASYFRIRTAVQRIQTWWRAIQLARSLKDTIPSIKEIKPSLTLSSSLDKNRKQLESLRAKIKLTTPGIQFYASTEQKPPFSMSSSPRTPQLYVPHPISSLSPKTLNAVTSRNTKQNGLYACHIVKQVVHKFCEPPPSPSALLEQRFFERQESQEQRDFAETARRAFEEQDDPDSTTIDVNTLPEKSSRKRKCVQWDMDNIVTVFGQDTAHKIKRSRTQSTEGGALRVKKDPKVPAEINPNETLVSPVKLPPTTVVVSKFVYPTPSQVLPLSANENDISVTTTESSESPFSFDSMEQPPQRKQTLLSTKLQHGGVMKKGISRGPRRVLKTNTLPSLPLPGTSSILSKPPGRSTARSLVSLGPPKRQNGMFSGAVTANQNPSSSSPISSSSAPPTTPSASLWRAQISDLRKKIQKK